MSYLSPYISRRVISTKFVLEHIQQRGYPVKIIEKFIQELAWRDYWQQIWIAKRDAIDSDFKYRQSEVDNFDMPRTVAEGKTGREAIDHALTEFYVIGYLHNHVRMYIAAISCNMGKCHWKIPAKWIYYYLLDADWASNALSWQWVAGSNSNKKYVAIQDNINKYCHTSQKNTFLDLPYEAFEALKTPKVLSDTFVPELLTPLPSQQHIEVHPELPTLLYNFYNLNPNWKTDILANRILLLEPSHLAKYPIDQKSIEFMFALGENIENLQVYVGEFDELMTQYNVADAYFKEHPLKKIIKETKSHEIGCLGSPVTIRRSLPFGNVVKRN